VAAVIGVEIDFLSTRGEARDQQACNKKRSRFHGIKNAGRREWMD
jgi:hypothetical protein